MAFQQGLSGLNTSSKALDVTSNNIANASTVGFKGAAAHFSDIYAASLAGAGTSQVGIGASNSAIAQQYTQGNITTTNNSLDVAINGNGFFRMSKDGAVQYSRNGQFHLDNAGYIVNDANMNLTGYPADANGNVVPTTPANLQVSTAKIPPQSTGTTSAGVAAALNLDSTKKNPTAAWVSPVGTNTPATDTYNYSTAMTIYDTLGNPHTLTMFFVHATPDVTDPVVPSLGMDPVGTTGAWNVHFQVDGTSESNVTDPNTPLIDPLTGVAQHDAAGNLITGTSNMTRLSFDSSGKLLTPMPPTNKFSVNLNGVATDLSTVANPVTNNAASPLTFAFNFTNTTQYGSAFSVNTLQQDGYTSGNLAGMSVGKDGVIKGNYSNGQTRNLGQVVLANFTNPNGLSSVGNNNWIETNDSGQPLIGSPNTGTLGTVQSGSVEDSNVDLTQELVNMIVQQRNYQANAQSIKTQDQIMQTLVNLR